MQATETFCKQKQKKPEAWRDGIREIRGVANGGEEEERRGEGGREGGGGREEEEEGGSW